MTSATHDPYEDRRWSNRNHGPWGGRGGGWGSDGWRTWSGGQWHPYWAPHFIPKPLLIVLTILGFMLWWPIGLVLLVVTLCRRSMFCGYHRWAGWPSASGPGASGPSAGWKGWFGGERPSSGNRAFDEYRAETLRRLEEEQKEFGEFLERLRFAKDKAEFDQFMNERRNRPQTDSPEPPQEPSS